MTDNKRCGTCKLWEEHWVVREDQEREGTCCFYDLPDGLEVVRLDMPESHTGCNKWKENE